MINKRLIKMVPNTTKYLKYNVILQILGLLCNIGLMFQVSILIYNLINNSITKNDLFQSFFTMLCFILFRVLFIYLAKKQSYDAAKSVKLILREKIYNKLSKIESKYQEKLSTAELLQLSVEGVDQLEIYFANYLPQFFYAMIAPIILFIIFSNMSFKVAIVLLIFVPLIPISIIIIQKIAKKLLFRYWGEYAGLADNFLENIQGLNTLKIYQSDEYKHQEMNVQAERFRVVTMKVLSMQLNSIIVMDIVAYGGACLGILLTISELSSGTINFQQALFMILLCFEFFLPLRLLGSYFHIAMNGIAASKKIFNLIDIDEDLDGNLMPNDNSIVFNNVSFAYNDAEVLRNVSLKIKPNQFISIVGESGCGKSTLAKIIMQINKNYKGEILFGNNELKDINRKTIKDKITMISSNAYIFKGSVKENLLMAKNDATDDELWNVLNKVNLKDFFVDNDGLDTLIEEKGKNLSGGQNQRLALARALLKDTEIYIFDEATSNIDVESENSILEVIENIKFNKTIIMISHRLANVLRSDIIYVLKDGNLVESGNHQDLVNNKAVYYEMLKVQNDLEDILNAN